MKRLSKKDKSREKKLLTKRDELDIKIGLLEVFQKSDFVIFNTASNYSEFLSESSKILKSILK